MTIPTLPLWLRLLLLPLLLVLSFMPYAAVLQLVDSLLPLSKDRSLFWITLFLQHFAVAVLAGTPLGCLVAIIYRRHSAYVALFLTTPIAYLTFSDLDLQSKKLIFYFVSSSYSVLAYIAIAVGSAVWFQKRIDALNTSILEATAN